MHTRLKMAIDKEHLKNILKFDCLQVGLDYSWGRRLEEIGWLKTFKVVDVGDISVPVLQEDLTKLLKVSCQVPPGDGLRTAVRHVWQIDESQISIPHLEFHSLNIPELAGRATQQLGIDPDALGIEAKPHHILLYPTGGYYRRYRDQGGKEQGAFATMLLQIPVEGGHKGGETKVWLRHQMKTFDTATESSHRFHLLVFYDDCEHELKPIVDGCRLVMVFHLYAKKSTNISLNVLDRPISIQALEDIRKTLVSWQEPETENDFEVLAIPLDHVYEKDNLLFSRLKGKDQLVARLFQSVDFVETHLAILTKCVTGSPNFAHEDYQHLRNHLVRNVKKELSLEPSNPPGHVNGEIFRFDGMDDSHLMENCAEDTRQFESSAVEKNEDVKNREVDYDFVVELLGYVEYIQKHMSSIQTEPRKMINQQEPVYTTDNWVGRDDRPASLRDLNIRVSLNSNESELVGVENEIFENNRPDDELMSLTDDPQQASLEFRYYRSLLVIWPQKRSFNVVCRSGIDNALKHLERTVKLKTQSAREESLANLRRLLWFCRTFPGEAWCVGKRRKKAPVTGQRSSRLLSLCIDLAAKEEGIDLLNIMGTEFRKDISSSPMEDEVYIYEGISTDQVAAGIAALVVMSGWSATQEAVTKLVATAQKSNWHHIGPSAVLSIKLLDAQCTDAAFTVGNLLCSALADVDLNALAKTDFPSLVSYSIMVIRLEESRQTSNPTRVFSMLEKLKSLEVRFLLRLVVRLFESVSDQIKKRSSCRYLYTVLCQQLNEKIDLSDKVIVNDLAGVTRCYFWLEDPSLLRSFVEKICRAAETAVEGTILDEVMRSLGIWKMSESPFIYEALERLIDARIAELSRIERPEFTWKQPNAKFRDHPDVEQFLRSDKPRMIYSRFSSVTKARKFTTDYFTSPTLPNEYSATIQIGGRGENAYCEIIKTRDVFNASLQKFFAYQQELKKLKSHRAASVVAGKRSKKNSETQPLSAKRIK